MLTDNSVDNSKVLTNEEHLYKQIFVYIDVQSVGLSGLKKLNSQDVIHNPDMEVIVRVVSKRLDVRDYCMANGLTWFGGYKKDLKQANFYMTALLMNDIYECSASRIDAFLFTNDKSLTRAFEGAISVMSFKRNVYLRTPPVHSHLTKRRGK